MLRIKGFDSRKLEQCFSDNEIPVSLPFSSSGYKTERNPFRDVRMLGANGEIHFKERRHPIKKITNKLINIFTKKV